MFVPALHGTEVSDVVAAACRDGAGFGHVGAAVGIADEFPKRSFLGRPGLPRRGCRPAASAHQRIHDQADDYLNDSKIGLKRAGYGGTEGIVRHAAFFTRRTDTDPFTAVITKCTTAADAVGMVFEGDDINFQTYAMNAVPQLDPSVWL